MNISQDQRVHQMNSCVMTEHVSVKPGRVMALKIVLVDLMKEKNSVLAVPSGSSAPMVDVRIWRMFVME